jgi:hypothetical protein
MVKYLRRKGVFLIVYLDDFVIMAPTKEELLVIRNTIVLPLLDRLGWVKEMSKSHLEPTQRTTVLGLVVDLQQGKFFVPEEKVKKIHHLVKKVQGKKQLSRRRLASIAGYIISVARAAPLVRLYCREIYALIGKADYPHAWNKKVSLSEAMKRDLMWISNNLERINGHPIWFMSQILKFCLQTDASDGAWGAIFQGLEAGGMFTREQQLWHIMYKEMLAVLLALQSYKGLLKGARLMLQTDNKTVVAYLEKGGGSNSDLNSIVKQIWEELYLQEAILVSTEWIRGATENKIADGLSRQVDGGDWKMKSIVFKQLLQKWDLQVDRFANHLNHQLPRFNSRLLCPGTEAIDAFQQQWTGVMNYWLTPFYLINRVLRQVLEQKAIGVIVVPQWYNQPWFPLLEVITVEILQLGMGSQIFEVGASGIMEPTNHGEWMFEARLIDGAKTTNWD